MSANPVVHFEMPYEDAERSAVFYRQAFGWGMENMGDEMGGYVTAETGPTENGRPTTPGTINGGFYPKAASTAQVPSVVIAVDDIAAAMSAVTAAGGQVLGEPMDIPGIGAYVSFTDTEGNRVSLLKPSRA
jgi:predicted enzyme related to lactoylglutathione lyase